MLSRVRLGKLFVVGVGCGLGGVMRVGVVFISGCLVRVLVMVLCICSVMVGRLVSVIICLVG